MQHGVAGDVRLAAAQDQRIGAQRHGLGAGVLDQIGDREHVAVVDGDKALEVEARAVVPGQRHRLSGVSVLPSAVQSVSRFGVLTPGRADEASLGPIGVGRAARRKQADVRALLVDRLAIVFEDDIVELAAFEVDRAAEARRVDRDARAGGERLGEGRQPERRWTPEAERSPALPGAALPAGAPAPAGA